MSDGLPRPTAPEGFRRGAWVWRAVRVPVVAFVGICLLMMFLENSLVYFPSKYPEDWWEPDGLAFEDAEFTASDGTRLHGWYVPSPQPKAVILFCHGNGGNLSHRYDLMRGVQLYVDASILVFDYRGYGKSEGAPHEAGILDDARAARAWLAQRAGVPEGEIVMMGESLGGGVAVDLAAKDGARALILESTFTSLPDAAAYHYPWLPVRWLMRNRLDSLSKIGDYQGPLLQFHGAADQIVPYALGERLFAAANEPKRLITFPGLDHNDARPARYFKELAAFIDELPAVK